MLGAHANTKSQGAIGILQSNFGLGRRKIWKIVIARARPEQSPISQ